MASVAELRRERADDVFRERDIPTGSPDELCAWLSARGPTDAGYLRGHFPRFAMTHAFACETLAPRATILDVGAHWLHQAAFFARDGHKLICADVFPDQMLGFVQPVAKAIGADLINIQSLDRADTFSHLPDDSVDALLFSEIIEHITFNPINMWKGFYRILKPGGRIYITTPNSMHFARIHEKLNAVVNGCEYGINVGEIISHGTFSHHWKEFSIPELRAYFAALSPDFVVDRVTARSMGVWNYPAFRERATNAGIYSLDQLVEALDRSGAQPFGEQILLDVCIAEKREGITISPPW